MEHDIPDSGSFEKFNRVFPKGIREAFLVAIGIAMYLVKTERHS